VKTIADFADSDGTFEDEDEDEEEEIFAGRRA